MHNAPMRIAAISDHGNLPALQAVLDHIAKQGVDVIVNLGDILSGPLWPCETAKLLMAQNFPTAFATLAGNHERQLLDCARSPGGASDQYAYEHTTPAQQQWLAALPGTLQLTPHIYLCHGRPSTDLEYLCETLDVTATNGVRMATQAELATRLQSVHAELILCGHSHQPRTIQLQDGRLIVNPGSVGLPAYDDDHGGFHKVENGSPHARYCICERDAQGWSVLQCAVAYDWPAAVAQAKRNGREDVAVWLTGRA
jgi:predicted phosphodiesterase